MNIRAPKDFWSGIMFLAFAAVALLAARGYSLGTAGRMGPGYFPMLLGGVLGVLGLDPGGAIAGDRGRDVGRLRLVAARRHRVRRLPVRRLAIERLGLVDRADRRHGRDARSRAANSRPLEFAALALVLAAFSVGVFVYALRLPLPVWPAL